MNDDNTKKLYERGASFKLNIHFGDLIKSRLKQDRRSVRLFAEQMNSDRSNMYKLLSRAHLDTNYILRASKVLEHNFFQDISDKLKDATKGGWGAFTFPNG